MEDAAQARRNVGDSGRVVRARVASFLPLTLSRCCSKLTSQAEDRIPPCVRRNHSSPKLLSDFLSSSYRQYKQDINTVTIWLSTGCTSLWVPVTSQDGSDGGAWNSNDLGMSDSVAVGGIQANEGAYRKRILDVSCWRRRSEGLKGQEGRGRAASPSTWRCPLYRRQVVYQVYW